MQICILSNEPAYPIVPPLPKQQNYIICCASVIKKLFLVNIIFPALNDSDKFYVSQVNQEMYNLLHSGPFEYEKWRNNQFVCCRYIFYKLGQNNHATD